MDPAMLRQPVLGAAMADCGATGGIIRSDEPAPRVSLVMPCYNGAPYLEESIGRLIRHIEARRESLDHFELIFVDDGSTDGSADIVPGFEHWAGIRDRMLRVTGGSLRVIARRRGDSEEAAV
jgi:hypothetical protein